MIDEKEFYPWERLRKLRKALPNTKLQMLLRGVVANRKGCFFSIGRWK